MVYKTVSEVVAAMSAEFTLPTFTKPSTSFTYVPWTESKKLLDVVFGIFGWSTTEPKVTFAAMADQGKATGVYTVSFGLVVKAIDDETGEVIEKMLPCVGQGVSYGADDNAAKSGMSDALSRGVKMLGQAFGFNLYEKGSSSYGNGGGAAAAPANGGQQQQNGNAPRGVSPANAGKPASDAQKGMLKRLNYAGDIDGLTMAQASEAINALKAAPATANASW